MNKRIFNSHTALTWALGIGGWHYGRDPTAEVSPQGSE
jgi:hypothetical protein